MGGSRLRFLRAIGRPRGEAHPRRGYATFDAKTLLVTVTFKPENKVQVNAIRDAVKGVGYTPGETRIVARGSLTLDNGEWRFLPSGLEKSFSADVSADLRKPRASTLSWKERSRKNRQTF